MAALGGTGAGFQTVLDWWTNSVLHSRRVKPGRKFIEQGAAACTDAEILAILIGTGGKGYSALDCARDILDRYGTLANLMDKPLLGLTETRGVNTVKAIRIAAAFEVAARIVKHLETNT